jgi:DNA-binding CsgD family transcriptional regulator/tetratricopeptide (TPR) repeat protein
MQGGAESQRTGPDYGYIGIHTTVVPSRAAAYGGPVGGAQGEVAALMVGRARELARVTRLLDDAVAGRGRLVLCTGEAGIGKTRLAEEAAALAAARGVPVAWARAADRGSSPPYGLWRMVLDDPAVRAGDGEASRADRWSAVFGEAERAAVAEGADSGSARRFALFAEVRRRLMEAARPSGLVLVLDDLQWADEASAALLTDVVRQLRGTPILVFATHRDSAAPGEVSAGLLQGLAADANTERVDLRGLTASAVGDMLLAAGLPASAETAGEVHSETGGNPFLVRELALMLVEESRGGPGSVPGRVVEATAYRLAQLSGPARELLQAAAVAGNSFSVGVVARMLDVPVLSLLGRLDECRTAGFLVAGDRRGDHRFSHALVGSAVIARLSAEEQRRLHSAAADAIEALYEGQLRLHLTEVARHRVEASWPGDRARAVAACEAAADVAAESLAFEEAVRLYRQALSVGGEEIREAGRDRLELALAAELHRSGDLPGAQQTAVRVGRRAEARRDRPWLARTALVMEATGVPEWDGEICRICEQALAGDDIPGDLRARVSARYAQALVYRGENDRAEQVSREALAAADAAADPVALVDALRARQLACSGPEGLAERSVLAGRMLEAASSLGSVWMEMWGRLWRIDTLFETGQLRDVQRELADLGSCLERLGGTVGRWHHLEAAATLALATGRFAEAARLAREAWKVFSDMGHPVAIGALAVILSQSALHVGLEPTGLAEAFDLIPAHLRPEAVDTTQGTATVFPALTLTLIRLHQGDRAGAEAAYALAGPIRSWRPMAAMRMACWGHGLAVAAGLGRTEDIEFLAERFEPFRGQHVANGAGAGVYMGPVELQLGLAATALGRLDAAVADLQAAASICDANGARGYAVQARVEFAAALVRRHAPGDLDQARAALDAAAGEAERLGMVPFTTRIAQLRDRLAGAAGVGAVHSPLSPREVEVARLVARGLTNKQIGQALFVSERTAENHVQHILIKLGFSNRSQIAAWLVMEAPAGRE